MAAHTSNRAGRRKFGLSLMLGLPCSGLMLLLLARLVTGSWKLTVPLGIPGGGFVLGLTLFLLPALALPFYRVWFALICVIDLVVRVRVMDWDRLQPAGGHSFQQGIHTTCATLVHST